MLDCARYGYIILYDTTSHLTLTKEIELLQTASTKLDQIILLTSHTPVPHQTLDKLNPRTLHLNRNLETLKLEIENFPFPARAQLVRRTLPHKRRHIHPQNIRPRIRYENYRRQPRRKQMHRNYRNKYQSVKKDENF